MEVICNEFGNLGVGRLGVWDLPGRFMKVDFGHFGAKSAIGGGPIDAHRKVFSRDALLPLLTLACHPFLRILHGPLGASRRCYLDGRAGALDTIALQDHNQ